jgi:hypothetical protein
MGERIELTSKTFAGEALLVANRLVQLTLDRVE